MNKDQIKGKVTEIAGSVERRAGELTGNKKTQAEGIQKQAKGKIQKAWGNVKSSVK
jgi:uncharacterized protein YjbJ (UPF0337 family)